MRTLVLWDIDRTLLVARIGADWFRRALVEVTGRDISSMPVFAGRTDRWVAREMLTDVGVEPTEDMINRLHETVTRIATEERHLVAERGTVLAGVPEVLREIGGRSDVVQTLVTGNLRPTAEIKVSAFGLDKYLDLALGGYGGTSEDRALLVAEALGRSEERHGRPARVVVVGDTPHDIEAALAHDARAVGVATGQFDAAALRESGAHVVLPDLADTGRSLAAILPDD